VFNSNGRTVNCQNTIIADNLLITNSGTTGAGPDFFGTLTSQGYNLIGNTTDTVILGITTGNLLNIDPLLGPLQNNGGPTLTHRSAARQSRNRRWNQRWPEHRSARCSSAD